MKFYAAMGYHTKGDPQVIVEGDWVVIYPTGVGDVHLSLSIEDWRVLSQEVGQAISANQDLPAGENGATELPKSFAKCPCGASMELYEDISIEEEREAWEDWEIGHEGCADLGVLAW